MVDTISDLFKLKDQGKTAPQKAGPAPQDIHAMTAAMDKTWGANDLGSLFSGRIQKAAGRKITAAPEHKQAQDSPNDQSGRQTHEDLVRGVAEQIFSGGRVDGERRGQNEVIIRIREDVLKGCHIHLLDEKDCLRVTLAASDEGAYQILMQGQHSLKTVLENTYSGQVRISVRRIPAPEAD